MPSCELDAAERRILRELASQTRSGIDAFSKAIMAMPE